LVRQYSSIADQSRLRHLTTESVNKYFLWPNKLLLYSFTVADERLLRGIKPRPNTYEAGSLH
jgi:hypothetical protein